MTGDSLHLQALRIRAPKPKINKNLVANLTCHHNLFSLDESVKRDLKNKVSFLNEIRLCNSFFHLFQWEVDQFYFFFTIEVLSIFIDSVLMDINNPLAANLKQLLGTVEAREMGHIGGETFGDPPFGTL